MQNQLSCDRAGTSPSRRTREKTHKPLPQARRRRVTRSTPKLQRLDQLAIAAGEIVSRLNPSDTAKSLAESLANEKMMVELLSPIEDEGSKHQATTRRGALFQLLLAAADLGELGGTANWDEDSLRDRHLRIEACVVSALNFLEGEFTLDRDDLGGAYFCRHGYKPQAR